MLQPTEIDRLLVVMVHPDDVDFGSAGTMATLTALGVHVTYCLVTDGDAGGSDRSITRTEMASMRRKEPVSYTHLRAHETVLDLVCRLLLEKKNRQQHTSETTPATRS